MWFLALSHSIMLAEHRAILQMGNVTGIQTGTLDSEVSLYSLVNQTHAQIHLCAYVDSFTKTYIHRHTDVHIALIYWKRDRSRSRGFALECGGFNMIVNRERV